MSFWQKPSVSVYVVVLLRKSSHLMKGNDAFNALYGDAFIDLLLPRRRLYHKTVRDKMQTN